MTKHAERLARAAMRAAGITKRAPSEDMLRMATMFEGMAREWAVIAREERAEARRRADDGRVGRPIPSARGGVTYGGLFRPKIVEPPVELTPTPLQLVKKGLG